VVKVGGHVQRLNRPRSRAPFGKARSLSGEGGFRVSRELKEVVNVE